MKSDFERAENARQAAQHLRETTGGKYYSAKEAIDEFNDAYGASEKTVAGAKLVGKSLFNIGRFVTSELLPGMLEQGAKDLEKRGK